MSRLGGVDISFTDSGAIGCLVILDRATLALLHVQFTPLLAGLAEPYVAGHLADREAAVYVELLKECKQNNYQFYPDLLFVDGNGQWHPLRYGLACKVGEALDIPCIGIAKNMLHIPSDQISKQCIQSYEPIKGHFQRIIGKSHFVYGAVVCTRNLTKPIYVSIGYKISLEDAISETLACSKTRIPEPTRLADIYSRQELQKCLQTRR